MKHCPTCWSIHIERAHRRPLERLISIVGILPFYCNECGNRFLARIPPRQHPTSRTRTPPPLPTESLYVLRPSSSKLNTNDSHPRMAP